MIYLLFILFYYYLFINQIKAGWENIIIYAGLLNAYVKFITSQAKEYAVRYVLVIKDVQAF